jgi:predicted DCC family thiol-disulfide oxidoreductase YuxK
MYRKFSWSEIRGRLPHFHRDQGLCHMKSVERKPNSEPSAAVRPTLGIQPMTRPATCTVYFDGACPVCRREIAHYRRQRGSESIAWVDASSCDEAELGPGLDRSVVLSRFHVRNADGTLTSGAAAFVAIWRRLPAFAWLAALASSRPVLALLEAGYSIFLRVRPWWRPQKARTHAAAPSGADATPPRFTRPQH